MSILLDYEVNLYYFLLYFSLFYDLLIMDFIRVEMCQEVFKLFEYVFINFCECWLFY